jgi:hypothetical protein|tara:strand:- start:6698 stop:7945 length:1248 start_codon:yes stop_codon:yes gene_type:complete
MAKKTKAQIEKELAEVEAIKNQLQEEKRQADGLPSTQDSAQGAIIREAQKLATQIVRERDALEQKTTTGKIYSRFDVGNDVISNRKEKVTAGIWSNGTGEIGTFHTASAQTSSNAGRYYWDVYNSSSVAVGSSVQFAIAYGHKQGSGSVITNEDYPTKAIYTQYKNLLLAPGDNKFTFDNKVDEEHILAINFQRARLKEKLDPGNWELVLSGSANGGSTSLGHNITKLIDNSGGKDATIQDGQRVYSVVSGTIAGGEVTTDDDGVTGGYGLVYPDLGIIVLNPGRLKERGIVPTGTVTASNTNNQYNSMLFNAISGAASYNSSYGFAARNEEEVTSTFYYVRVKNADYNFSNNPTFSTGSLGALRHPTMIKDPKTYITTVGLYNDRQELLATAKLSKPLIKSFDRESLIKVKLDF